MAFVENTIIWTGKGDVIRLVLDRVDQAIAGDRLSHDMYKPYEELAVRWDLFGNLEVHEELITWLLSVTEKRAQGDAPDFLGQVSRYEPQLRMIERARFGFDIVSGQVLEGELTLQLDSAESARTWSELLATAGGTSSDFEISSAQEGRSAVFQIRTDHLAEMVRDLFPNP